MTELFKVVITSEFDGVPLRNYLRGTLRISTGICSQLKKTEEGITVNGNRVTVRYILRQGDLLILKLPDEEASDILPVQIPINIIYEDEDILAVNKPSDMPTHPSHGHFTDTLANALAYYYREQNFVFRAVNRLDRDTSGIVLIAKSRYAASVLGDEMLNGRIKKTYYALCHGQPPVDEGTIDINIERAEESIIFRRVCAPDFGKRAVTIYKRITTYKHPSGIISLMKLQPMTGRTHQLRVHTSACGFPILHDGLYGDGFDGGLSSLALHAGELTFTHPTSGIPMNLCTKLPSEWKIIDTDIE